MVVFQGQPLAGGLVVFTPDPDRGGSGQSISAELTTDGRFQLKIGDETAVLPGWYRVAIAASPMSASRSAVFPPQLARPDRSGLVREVKPGRENEFEFIIDVP